MRLSSAGPSALLMCLVAGCASAQKDADHVCAIATELQAGSSMNPTALGEAFVERVEDLSMTRESQLWWAAIRFTVPEDRYRIFQQTFAEQGVEDWECEPLRELLAQAELPRAPEPAPPP